MTVYIEDYIIINLIMNLCVCLVTISILRKRKSFKRVIVACLVATTISFLYNIIIKSSIVTMALTLPTGAILSGSVQPHPLFKTSLVYLAVANTMAVISNFIISIPIQDITISRIIGFSPIIAILVALFLAVYAEKIIHWVRRNKPRNTNVQVEIESKGQTIITNGFVDTGNDLTAFDGTPISIMDESFASKIELEYTGKHILVKTINATDYKKVYKPKQIVVRNEASEHKYERVYFVVSDTGGKGIILNAAITV